MAWDIYAMEYYSSIRKNEIMAFAATCMDRRARHTECSQSEKEKHHNVPFMWNVRRNDTNEMQMVLTKQKEIHRLRKRNYGCLGEGIIQDFGKVMYTLIYFKWITNKYLLYRKNKQIKAFLFYKINK